MPIPDDSILNDTRPLISNVNKALGLDKYSIPGQAGNSRTDNKPVAYNHGRRYLSKRSYNPARFRDNISHVEKLNPFYTT